MTRNDRSRRERIPEDVLAEHWFDIRHAAYEELLQAFHEAQKTGLRQDDIATRLGRDKGFISRCLRGEGNITLRTMSNIARAMDCRLDVRLTPLDTPPRANHRLELAPDARKQARSS